MSMLMNSWPKPEKKQPKFKKAVSASYAAVARRERKAVEMVARKPMTLRELGVALGYPKYNSAWKLLQNLVQDGFMTRQGPYYISTGKQLSSDSAQESVTPEPSKLPEPVSKADFNRTSSAIVQQVTQLAMQAAWETKKPDMTLREFIDHINGK